MEKNLKELLEKHYKYFDKTKISPDPLEFPHQFSNQKDIEVSALISALFAYGNIKQIMKTLEKIHSIMNWQPHKFVLNYSSDKNLFVNVKHRFYTSEDIHQLLIALNYVYEKYGSIKKLFLSKQEKEFNLKNSLEEFSSNMIEIISRNYKPTHGIIFMFPNPKKNSACKRMNLFLRWMVRKDELDFGIWKEFPTSKLIIPVDVHISRICKRLNLTKQNNVSWKMAEDITKHLQKYDANDPVKYDFAICHIGMRKMSIN